VFSGRHGAYREDDVPDPIDLYGRSKLLGEVDSPGALTLRTSIIGRELEHFTGLLEWFLRSGPVIGGYTRVIWSGVTTNFLARLVGTLIATTMPQGLFHVSSFPISKHDLLVALNDAFDRGARIEPQATPESDRSLESERFWSRTGLNRPRWDDMIGDLVDDSRVYEGLTDARR
jgi:dTDP-4-dehydrorhamnose reductase